MTLSIVPLDVTGGLPDRRRQLSAGTIGPVKDGRRPLRIRYGFSDGTGRQVTGSMPYNGPSSG